MLRYLVWRGFFREKSQRFGAKDGDACGYRDSLEGVVVATLSVIGLRVKTLDLCGLGNGGACCVVTSLEALSWSLGLFILLAASCQA
jgi:hypothetical protein